MDERPAGMRADRGRRGERRSLAMAGTRYPIVSEDASSCLIEAPASVRIRGYADIYDGERHRAHCLVVLSRSEGAFLRVIYKRRTPARADPPADYAAAADDDDAAAGFATDYSTDYATDYATGEAAPRPPDAAAAARPGQAAPPPAPPGPAGWASFAARFAFRRGDGDDREDPPAR